MNSSKSNSVLTVLGCGTSTGVPLPACRCSVCTSKSVKNKRTRTSAWIQHENGTSIIIDTGPDFRQQVLREGVQAVDAVLYTHAHADHILGLDDLRCFNFAQARAIPCYGTAETLSAIQNFFSYIFSPDPEYRGGKLAQLSLHEFNKRDEFLIQELAVQVAPVEHGSTAVSCFRFGNLAYVTDCHAIDQETQAILFGVEHLILDGLRHEPHRTHFTIDAAVEMAATLQAKQTYLTHMTHTIDYEVESEKLPRGVQLCYDGLRIPFFF